jgi:hypothetical protein
MRTTIEMAREAAGDDWGLFQEFMPEIHKLTELVRADERARMAEQPAQQEPVGSVHVDTLAMLPSIKPIDGGAKIYPVSKAKYDAAYRLIYTSPPAQRTWVEVEQVKWEGDRLIAKFKENT